MNVAWELWFTDEKLHVDMLTVSYCNKNCLLRKFHPLPISTSKRKILQITRWGYTECVKRKKDKIYTRVAVG